MEVSGQKNVPWVNVFKKFAQRFGFKNLTDKSKTFIDLIVKTTENLL